MAKRAVADESSYNPLDATLARSVIQGAAMVTTGSIPPEGHANAAAMGQFRQSPKRELDEKNMGLNVRTQFGNGPNPTRSRSLSREKRVLLFPDEERQVERLVDRIGEELGTSLKLSHLLRACMTVLCHVEQEILHHAVEFRPLPRPANGDAVALAQFEQTLATVLSKAFRDAPVLR
jgi:hypothetical protein